MQRKKEKDKENSLLPYSEGEDNLWYSSYVPQNASEQSHQDHKRRPTKVSGEGQ